LDATLCLHGLEDVSGGQFGGQGPERDQHSVDRKVDWPNNRGTGQKRNVTIKFALTKDRAASKLSESVSARARGWLAKPQIALAIVTGGGTSAPDGGLEEWPYAHEH
jgi:hypothetical protein